MLDLSRLLLYRLMLLKKKMIIVMTILVQAQVFGGKEKLVRPLVCHEKARESQILSERVVRGQEVAAKVKIVNRWFMVQTLVPEDNLETEDKLEAKDNLEGRTVNDLKGV